MGSASTAEEMRNIPIITDGECNFKIPLKEFPSSSALIKTIPITTIKLILFCRRVPCNPIKMKVPDSHWLRMRDTGTECDWTSTGSPLLGSCVRLQLVHLTAIPVLPALTATARVPAAAPPQSVTGWLLLNLADSQLGGQELRWWRRRRRGLFAVIRCRFKSLVSF